LFTHLRLGLPSGLFPSGFPTNVLSHNILYFQHRTKTALLEISLNTQTFLL
jgi:hypothetical protein